ncbi:MAG TPA: methyl-accepting chemotaxis protein [Defluviitoga sp.]|nr:methyl-accepting chemotaxis protein [Defluviitoga sp.]HOP23728.1 methyl-accepting chemotaxis protein [Defluviitoga sp.]HPZ28942.1 methyl-accepting chemotaxis protein [Defluviitoga sp.]HQD62987.1 methyl-accepting chemotaxis protein [Defluviitoga sp.]
MNDSERYKKTINFLSQSVYHENLLVSFINRLEEVLGERFKKSSKSTKIVGENLIDSINSIKKSSETLEKTVNDGNKEIETISKKNQEIVTRLNVIGEDFDELEKKVEKSLKTVSNIIGSFKEINELTSIIKNVAKQTNILSINASIEAARAGEQGRGFAVVAEEIKKLSSETNNTSDKISLKVDKIEKEIEEVKVVINNLNTIFEMITISIEDAMKILNENLIFMKKMTQDLLIEKEKLKFNVENLENSKKEINKLMVDINSLQKVLQAILEMQNKIKEIKI